MLAVNSPCNDGDIALMNGSSSEGEGEGEGRVEVYLNSTWTAVSQYGATGWDYNDAQVVCRQLNLSYQCKPIYVHDKTTSRLDPYIQLLSIVNKDSTYYYKLQIIVLCHSLCTNGPYSNKLRTRSRVYS